MRKRLRSLNRGLTSSLDTDAEALHRTRVATRRVREALPLLVPVEGLQPLREVKHLVVETTHALGGVREMDVALKLADTLIGERPDLEPVLALVRSAMATERLARLERMRREVDVRRLRRASRDLTRRVGQLADQAQSADLLAERMAERTDDLRRAVTRAGLLYAPERLHRVRLTTKKLRYTLELAGEMRAASTGRLVRELQRTQDRLGLLHDLEIVAQHARRAFAQPNVPEPAMELAAAVLCLLDERIHAQHADYLVHRERLLQVIDRATGVRERLLGRGPARVGAPRRGPAASNR